jgi:WhiB family redox-sensing transcriptional regulator
MSLAEKESAFEPQLQSRMVELMMQSDSDLPDAGDFLRRPSWQARSACRDEDMNEFFPEGASVSRETQQLCALCPVSVECLNFALADPSLKGVWAGTSERGRMRMRVAVRQRQLTA